MRAARLSLTKFRGIRAGNIFLPKHGVLIGDNNIGKTTILEALDLALGPDRLNRRPPIDEHDFFRGEYTSVRTQSKSDESAERGARDREQDGQDGQGAIDDTVRIAIEVTVVDLSEEQKARFGNHVEFWDSERDEFYDEPSTAGVDSPHITEALRVTFHGWYDDEEDDFEGRTFFTRSLTEQDEPEPFSRRDKQVCGFLYLRALRTGSRALSLERGSLLDIILRLKEVRPRMWEDALDTLSGVSLAEDPALGISPVLKSIDTSLKKYVPKEWGVQPHLRVSNLTREHLRKVITAFVATGEGGHAAPYYRQGTGTINMLVLAMLSQIAEDKQNVIFAMEEPETAVPPYAQKRIVHEVRGLASQTLFTSHSPYVLEEFATDEMVVLERDSGGVLSQKPIELPKSVKLKRYQREFRNRFCEGLLSRRVLIAEGATERTAFPTACRRLAELNPQVYSSLEALGICTVDAGGETNIPDIAKLYRGMGKRTFALCDHQNDEKRALIEAQVDLLLMHPESGFERLVLSGTDAQALRRFAELVDWPPHLEAAFSDPGSKADESLESYFTWSKGTSGVADLLSQCSEAETPEWIKQACRTLKAQCEQLSPAGVASPSERDPSQPPNATD